MVRWIHSHGLHIAADQVPTIHIAENIINTFSSYKLAIYLSFNCNAVFSWAQIFRCTRMPARRRPQLEEIDKWTSDLGRRQSHTLHSTADRHPLPAPGRGSWIWKQKTETSENISLPITNPWLRQNTMKKMMLIRKETGNLIDSGSC